MSEPDFGEDPDLEPAEKQFSVTSCKDEQRVRVHSEIGSVTRRIWHHPEASVEHSRTISGTVVAITATLPISCLSVKGTPRANENWSQVVSGGVLDD